jgi:SAM-dependent methyltransferase
LWLHVHKRGSLKEYFLGNLDGAELDEVYRRFGFFGAARPTLWLDLWLPYQLQRFMRGSAGKLRAKVEQDRGDSRPLAMNLERLKRKIDKLARLAHNTGRWTDYATDNSYRPSETERKEAFVRDFLDAHRPGRVLDLGCNTGRFSELASAFGADVVSVDSDPMCVDRLYRRARDRGSSILPLVIDLASPSPGMGFKNLERQSFLGRSSFDGVLALALVHHLLVTHRLPLEAIRDLLCDLTTGYLVVEFVEPQDPMFVSLLGARENLYKDLTPAAFVGVFERRFELISQAAVTPHRTIFRFRKRA